MRYGKKPGSRVKRNVADYRISEVAKQDLLAIARYGDEHYGVEQSNLYRDGLKQRFLIIVKEPMLYPAVDHIHAGYRRSIIGKHSIYYRFKDNVVEIMRVLGRQDFGNQVL